MCKYFNVTLILFTLFFLLVHKQVLANNSKEIYSPLLVEIKINHRKMDHISKIYIDKNKKVLVSESHLKEWKFKLSTKKIILINSQSYYRLDDIDDLHYQLDTAKLILSIEAGYNNFIPQIFIDYIFDRNFMRPKSPGGFINYDFAAFYNDNDSEINYSLLYELGTFNQFGVGSLNMVHYSPNQVTQNNVRLDAAWQIDRPEGMTTWIIGDAITSSSSWSGATRFGGIQYSRNFATQPGFITFPLPSISGEANLPSTLDILVKNATSKKQEINSGEYYINEIPVITGAGTISVIAHDILGRTTILTIPYYASPILLKKDLTSFSYETGFIRNNFGIDSNDYGRFLATGTYQRGISDLLTMGTHGELLFNQQTLGFSANYLFNQFGVISAALAGSHSEFGLGKLLSLGFNRQTDYLSYGFTSTFASKNFLQVGLQPGPLPSNITNQIFMGYQTPKYGSFNVSYTSIKNHVQSTDSDEEETQKVAFFTASYNKSIMKNMSFILSSNINPHHSYNNQYIASLIITLDQSRSLSAYTSYQNHQFQPAVQLTKNLPLGDGYGYHLMSFNNPSESIGGDVSLRNRLGTYTARAFRINHTNNYEIDISGGLVRFGGETIISNKITDSFALVQIPDYKNIRVYYQNQLAGTTNSRGNLLIPQILPYQENVIEIDSRDIPLDSALTETKKIVVPYYMSGELATFNVKHVRSIELSLVEANDRAIPAGSIVHLKDDPANYFVGFEGFLYLENIERQVISGIAEWDDKRCHFTIDTRNKHSLKVGKVACYS